MVVFRFASVKLFQSNQCPRTRGRGNGDYLPDNGRFNDKVGLTPTTSIFTSLHDRFHHQVNRFLAVLCGAELIRGFHNALGLSSRSSRVGRQRLKSGKDVFARRSRFRSPRKHSREGVLPLRIRVVDGRGEVGAYRGGRGRGPAQVYAISHRIGRNSSSLFHRAPRERKPRILEGVFARLFERGQNICTCGTFSTRPQGVRKK